MSLYIARFLLNQITPRHAVLQQVPTAGRVTVVEDKPIHEFHGHSLQATQCCIQCKVATGLVMRRHSHATAAYRFQEHTHYTVASLGFYGFIFSTAAVAKNVNFKVSLEAKRWHILRIYAPSSWAQLQRRICGETEAKRLSTHCTRNSRSPSNSWRFCECTVEYRGHHKRQPTGQWSG